MTRRRIRRSWLAVACSMSLTACVDVITTRAIGPDDEDQRAQLQRAVDELNRVFRRCTTDPTCQGYKLLDASGFGTDSATFYILIRFLPSQP